MEDTVFSWRPLKKKGHGVHRAVGDGFGGRDAGMMIIKATTCWGPAPCWLLSRHVPQPISFLSTTISKGDRILPTRQRRKPRLSQIQELCQGHRAKEATEAGFKPKLTLRTY